MTRREEKGDGAFQSEGKVQRGTEGSPVMAESPVVVGCLSSVSCTRQGSLPAAHRSRGSQQLKSGFRDLLTTDFSVAQAKCELAAVNPLLWSCR